MFWNKISIKIKLKKKKKTLSTCYKKPQPKHFCLQEKNQPENLQLQLSRQVQDYGAILSKFKTERSKIEEHNISFG